MRKPLVHSQPEPRTKRCQVLFFFSCSIVCFPATTSLTKMSHPNQHFYFYFKFTFFFFGFRFLTAWFPHRDFKTFANPAIRLNLFTPKYCAIPYGKVQCKNIPIFKLVNHLKIDIFLLTNCCIQKMHEKFSFLFLSLSRSLSLSLPPFISVPFFSSLLFIKIHIILWFHIIMWRNRNMLKLWYVKWMRRNASEPKTRLLKFRHRDFVG